MANPDMKPLNSMGDFENDNVDNIKPFLQKSDIFQMKVVQDICSFSPVVACESNKNVSSRVNALCLQLTNSRWHLVEIVLGIWSDPLLTFKPPAPNHFSHQWPLTHSFTNTQRSNQLWPARTNLFYPISPSFSPSNFRAAREILQKNLLHTAFRSLWRKKRPSGNN